VGVCVGWKMADGVGRGTAAKTQSTVLQDGRTHGMPETCNQRKARRTECKAEETQQRKVVNEKKSVRGNG